MVKGLRQAINGYAPPYIIHLVYIGWVGVGWRRDCKIRLSLGELYSQGIVFVFGGYQGWRSS